ncbi:MAG: anti-sigma factor RsbA family regulatory protein [Actinomycetota bacterium]
MSSQPFKHEALFYQGEAAFVDETIDFILEGIEAEEPILVVVPARKIEGLKQALDSNKDLVMFADMAEVGRNPARIIPVWKDLLDQGATTKKKVRGIGEPIWAGRSEAELAEAQRHEDLINLAFDGLDGWILCPYDVSSLDQETLDEAYRSHPEVRLGGTRAPSDRYRGLASIAQPFDKRLPEPNQPVVEFDFDASALVSLRNLVAVQASYSGLSAGRIEDLVLAIHEVAANTLRHGGGKGHVRVWTDPLPRAFVCEIQDSGRIEDPLVGRRKPTGGHEGGFGLWMVNQVCDLVQIRTYPEGSVVRIQVAEQG